MLYAIVSVLSACVGALLVYMLLESRRRECEQVRHARDEARADREVLERDRAEVTARKVSFDELREENRLLKSQIATSGILIRKSGLDRQTLAEQQDQLSERTKVLAERYLADVAKWIASSITSRNYASCRQKLETVVGWCRDVGFEVAKDRKTALLDALKKDFEEEVRKSVDREEQARLRAQIKEEQARERETQKVLDSLAREKHLIQEALAKAMAQAGPGHAAEVEHLKARLAEAEARNERALSQAQLTKAGHIYVISNVGALGENVFKIGMTRRLDPIDRVQELGDASVPFPFDVHMMISCDDAPTLEAQLHRQFHKFRVNKVNPRKEFFKVSLEEIRSFVVERQGEVTFIAEAAASEFRQSVEMSNEDQEYIEQVFDKAAERHGTPDSED